MKAGGKQALVSCSAYSSTLKKETICSSETSVDFQRTTRRYIPEDSTLHNHRCENLTSYNIKVARITGCQILKLTLTSHSLRSIEFEQLWHATNSYSDIFTVQKYPLPKGYHLDAVGGPSTPHDPESDAGGSLSPWQGHPSR
jgi:hypothetical protein